jgi:hypothetical protein
LTRIADSSAFRDDERVLPQHQAALTLLQDRLSAPAIVQLAWLDLACGRGQIISALDRNLSVHARSKIDFWAFDLDQDFARETTKSAERLDFASLNVKVGDLADFHRILPPDTVFDFLTLTNTVHEVDPASLANLLVDCVLRLSDGGTLFIYDMEQVNPPELGAVPWTRDDVRQIVRTLLDGLGAAHYQPEAGLWTHRSCNGWNVQLQRQHLNVSREDAVARSIETKQRTKDEILNLIKRRLDACHAALENLTRYGAETAEEQQDKERLLFEFWALHRSLGGRR